MKILSIDIETTGLDSRVHGITEFAAVATDIEGKLPLEAFYVWMNPEGMLWSQYCLNLHYEWIGKVNERIKAKDTNGRGLDHPAILNGYDLLYRYFREWAFGCGFYQQEMPSKRTQKPTVAGKNFGTFDSLFLNHRFGEEAFRKRVIDPAHYYIDFHEDGDIPPDLETCKARAIAAGCKFFQNKDVKHDALHDAMDVVYLLQFAYGKGWICPG